MATTVFTGYSKANDTLLRLRAKILDWQGITTIAQQTENAPHPIRLWNFPGLPRANYIFSLDIINGGDIAIENLAYFNIVPGMLNGSINRGDEQYQVDAVDSGLVAGETVAVFDGTDGKPDFRDWSVWPSISAGPTNPLVKGLDFSWDETTGTLTLLQPGDSFQPNAWWHFKFDSQDNAGAQSIPTVFDYTIRLITSDDDIEYEDFANAIITEPEDELLLLQLPVITTIPVGRELKIQFGGSSLSSTKLVPNGADVLPETYGLPGESLIIYRYQRSDLSNEWKIKFVGNNKQVGNIVYNDQIQGDILGYKRLDEVVCNIRKDARLYYLHVVNLPGTQVCNFDDWATGNNKYLFSLANDDGDFHVPDRRGMYNAATLAQESGDFVASQVGQITVPVPVADTYNGHFGAPTKTGSGNDNPTTIGVVVNAGLKTRPETIFQNQYVIL